MGKTLGPAGAAARKDHPELRALALPTPPALRSADKGLGMCSAGKAVAVLAAGPSPSATPGAADGLLLLPCAATGVFVSPCFLALRAAARRRHSAPPATPATHATAPIATARLLRGVRAGAVEAEVAAALAARAPALPASRAGGTNGAPTPSCIRMESVLGDKPLALARAVINSPRGPALGSSRLGEAREAESAAV